MKPAGPSKRLFHTSTLVVEYLLKVRTSLRAENCRLQRHSSGTQWVWAVKLFAVCTIRDQNRARTL